ncbi:MAG: FG-GAP repeat protein [Planctomycetes bacterium]|nr:FG-GAP repeat protein [Planctomycetota bacterium]
MGASLHDASCPQNADCNSGAVYVFHRTGTTWVETQKLTALDTGEADNFGKSVAVRGDLAVVGVDGDDDFAFNTGAAYVFRREGESFGSRKPSSPPMTPTSVTGWASPYHSAADL